MYSRCSGLGLSIYPGLKSLQSFKQHEHHHYRNRQYSGAPTGHQTDINCHWYWLCSTSLLQLADRDRGTNASPEPESWEEWAGEVFPEAMDELCFSMGDPVEGQQAFLLVQVNADPVGFRPWQGSFLAIVPQGEGCARPVETPGVGVIPQSGAVITARPLHFPVGHTDGHLDEIEVAIKT